MSQRKLVSGLPLAAGFTLVSIAVLNVAFSEGIFMLEWMGSFLVFYGVSYLLGSKMAMTLSGVVLVVGSLGDIALIGGLNSLDWIIVNYMVFIHAALGSLAGYVVKEKSA